MKKKLLAMLLFLSVTAVSTAGCGSKIKATDLMADVKSTNEIQVSTVPKGDTVTATDFAVRLFQNAKNGEENVLISPLSVIPSLSMTANGANGDTRLQMEQTLGMPIDTINRSLFSYMKDLPKSKRCRFQLANSIWIRDTDHFKINPDFLQTNANWFQADVFQTKFDDSTISDINLWVSNKTDHEIPKIIDTFSKDTMLCLINALTFDSQWNSIYNEVDIYDHTFTAEDGTSQDVELMTSTEYEYLEDEYATGFIKPYAGFTYGFAALLPKKGLSLNDYVNLLTGELLHDTLASVNECPVTAGIPKFDASFSIDLKETLQTLGIQYAFDPCMADFQNIGTFSTKDSNLYMGSVFHSSTISVAEKGTKAGAATSVEVEGKTSSPNVEEPKQVILDRPFLYMIIDYKNRFPIFIGTADDLS